MAVGDDNTVDLIFTAQTEEAAAKARALATGVESDLQGIAAQPTELPLGTDQAEASLARLATEIEGVRAEVLTPTLLEIDAAAAAEAVAAVGVGVEELGAELAVVGEAAGALPLAAPFLEATPAVEGFKEEVEGIPPALAELPAAVSPALAQIEAGFLAAEGAVDRFVTKAESGSKRIAQPMTAARVAVIQLKESIESLGPESGESVAVLEERLRELEARIDSGTEAWGRFRAQARITSIELKEAAVQAGAAHGSLDDLVEGSLSKFPKMEAAVFKAASAITVLQLAYSETRHLVEAAKLHLGIDIDESIQQAMIDLSEIVTLRAQAQKQLEESDENLNNLEQRLLASQKELQANGITYVRTADSMAAALRKLEEAHQGVEVEARKFVESILESDGAVNKERAAIMAGLPVVVERGVRTAAAADLIVERLNAEIEALKRLGQSSAGLEAIRDQMIRLSESLKLQDGIDSLKKFSDAVAASGRVTTEQADKIASEAARIIKAIRELPPEEQRAMTERLAYLQRLQAGYEKFTTAHAEMLKKQAAEAKKEADAELAELKRREDATRTFLDTIRGLLAKPLTPPKGTGDSAEVAAAKAELAALEKKSGEGFVSAQDLERMAELKAHIADLGASFGSLSRQTHGASADQVAFGAAGEEAAAKARDALVTLLGKSSEFGAALKAMTPEMRDSLRQLTEGFLSDLGGGLVKGQGDVAAFVQKFVDLLQSSGQVSGKFGAEMAAAFGQGTDSLDRLFDAASGTASGMGVLASGAASAEPAVGSLGATTAAAASAVADGSGSITQAFSAVAVQAHGVEVSVSAAGDATKKAAAGFIQAHDPLAALDGVGGHLVQSFVEIPAAASAAASAVVETGHAAGEAASSVKDLAAGMDGVKASGDALQEPAADARKLADAAAPAAEGVGAIGRASGDATPLLKAMATEASGDTEALRLMRVEVQGLRGDLLGLNTVMAATVRLCGDLNKCRAGASA